jgi:hypothetical protein
MVVFGYIHHSLPTYGNRFIYITLKVLALRG